MTMCDAFNEVRKKENILQGTDVKRLAPSFNVKMYL